MSLTNDEIFSIREIYKNKLVIPNKIDIPTQQFFLCTVGLVGAGKSTVIKPLSKKLSLVRISSDEIRQILKERKAGYEELMEIVKPLAGELAAQRLSLAFDADCGNPKTKAMIKDLANKVGARVFWIHINPPEDFIINKLKTYNHTWLFKNSDEAVENYFKQKEKRREENTPFDFLTTIDTSRPDLQAQIENVTLLIKTEISR